jgi:hypothetical protein
VSLSERKVTVFRLDSSKGRTICSSADNEEPFTRLLDSRFIKVSRFSSGRVVLPRSSDLLTGGGGSGVCLELWSIRLGGGGGSNVGVFASSLRRRVASTSRFGGRLSSAGGSTCGGGGGR